VHALALCRVHTNEDSGWSCCAQLPISRPLSVGRAAERHRERPLTTGHPPSHAVGHQTTRQPATVGAKERGGRGTTSRATSGDRVRVFHVVAIVNRDVLPDFLPHQARLCKFKLQVHHFILAGYTNSAPIHVLLVRWRGSAVP
jgi:hypothetical protein